MNRTFVSAAVSFAVCLACATPRAQPLVLASAEQTQAREADHAELLRLHQRQRAAHLQRRADWLVSEWADSLVSISRGEVSIGSRNRGQAGFQEYLDGATFQAWDDIAPPRIRISSDGQMAYVVVQKRVHLTGRGADAAAESERTRFAWLSVYEKQGGQWRLAAIASTERPDSL
jgi:ketosteroid isomerase-like protein